MAKSDDIARLPLPKGWPKLAKRVLVLVNSLLKVSFDIELGRRLDCASHHAREHADHVRPETSECPACGEAIRFLWNGKRFVSFVGSRLHIDYHIYTCVKSGCPLRGRHFRPEFLTTRVLPKREFGLDDENLLLATLLTGDPVLLVGSHGTAKTGLFMKIAEALGLRAISYDASKALFEDVLGYPNPKELLEGRVRYIASDVTIWDKEFVLIDELNRAQAEMQNKWLEIIRSRRVMGAETAVSWVWAAMNPKSYSATHTLDDALVGRFAMCVYPPEVLSMDEVDRARVACHMNGDDAPALGCWADDAKPKAKSNVKKQPRSVAAVGTEMKSLLTRAAKLFASLKSDLPRLGEFLARFADLAFRETKGEVKLDGRRLGFIYRNLLANRAVELAKAEAEGVSPPEFRLSARYVVLSSIPVGLNDETVNREETDHKVQVVFDLLSGYFDEGSDFERTDRVYELRPRPERLELLAYLRDGEEANLPRRNAEASDALDRIGELRIARYVTPVFDGELEEGMKADAILVRRPLRYFRVQYPAVEVVLYHRGREVFEVCDGDLAEEDAKAADIRFGGLVFLVGAHVRVVVGENFGKRRLRRKPQPLRRE
jgi:MoxR-like ATPase